MIYDLVAIAAILMILTLAVVALRGGQPVAGNTIAFQLLLLAAHWLYFAYCWRFGRQTLGMRAWQVWLNTSQPAISWRTTLLRYVGAWLSLAVAGAGFWSSLWHPARLTWHDRLSGTWLEHRPR